MEGSRSVLHQKISEDLKALILIGPEVHDIRFGEKSRILVCDGSSRVQKEFVGSVRFGKHLPRNDLEALEGKHVPIDAWLVSQLYRRSADWEIVTKYLANKMLLSFEIDCR